VAGEEGTLWQSSHFFYRWYDTLEEFGDGQGTARQLHDKFLHDIRIPPFFFYFSSLLLSVAATAPTRDFSEKNVFAISIK
jgi:hypothetical protein